MIASQETLDLTSFHDMRIMITWTSLRFPHGFLPWNALFNIVAWLGYRSYEDFTKVSYVYNVHFIFDSILWFNMLHIIFEPHLFIVLMLKGPI